MARIIIGENDRYRRSLSSVLKSHGHEVTGVKSGKEALELVARQRPDVVLLLDQSNVLIRKLEHTFIAVCIRNSCV